MIWRLPLAFVVGLVIYMIAMAMTVYDGFLSMIFQPIVGSIFTLAALAVVTVLGSPLLIKSVWIRWQHWWSISLLIFAAGIVTYVSSWDPALRVQVWDPDLQTMKDSGQPVLMIGGWLAMMFSVVYCPLIGLYGDRRWV